MINYYHAVEHKSPAASHLIMTGLGLPASSPGRSDSAVRHQGSANKKVISLHLENNSKKKIDALV